MVSRVPYLGRDRKNPLNVMVTQAERTAIKARAAEAGLSVASYLRAAALGKQIVARFDHTAIAEMVDLAGDQKRLGDLLKLWLSEWDDRIIAEADLQRALVGVTALQTKLAEVVGRI